MNQNNEFSTMLALHNTLGWHMRPAGVLVGVANMFESEIMVKCGQRIASAKSLLGVLTLGAGRGARLYVSARGRDAQMAIKAIIEKFSSDSGSGVKPYDAIPRIGGKISFEGKANKKVERIKEASGVRKIPPKGHVVATFKCNVKPEAKSVFLAGDFNGWDPQAEPMIKRGRQFSKCVKLAPGKYHYKYIVDGEWRTDPAAPLEVSGLGSTNNVICV